LSGRNPESYLIIGISNSGEVARTIEALEIWSDAGARTLAFTSIAESTLARIADQSLVLPPPSIPHGPGLLSYIGSLLLGFATLVHSILDVSQHRIIDLIDQTPELLREWLPNEVVRSKQFAGTVSEGIAVFLGSGAAHGSARFGAAKVIEAVGERCWAQDVEEWAHLEYFCEPAAMSTILLSAQGRSSSRELEVIEAMNVLGRTVLLSNWMGGKGWSSLEREALSPLALWAAPCAYASQRAETHSAKPFRDFGGGRDRQEGGGASRIRSSKRVGLEDLERLI
jgi:glucosamine--fructose-6-phosphate aminotransferase (isomerizing)